VPRQPPSTPVGDHRQVSISFDCADAAERESGIAAAARAVAGGQLVVVPTDTLYGIGADAFDGTAVAALLEAKGRGRDMPVPVLVGSWDTLEGLVPFVPDRVRQLVEAFWPGGLTLIVTHAPSLDWDLGDARGTVAVRMPLHPVALELLTETGPMAVSSANRSGRPPATTCAEAQEQLADAVSVYLDGGPSQAGVASTIVDVTAEVPRVVRHGAVGVEALREVDAQIVG
jgi:L-threonylcarbamoyladenylate synthase